VIQRWWQAGETAVIREVWAGRVFEARPCTVVQDGVQQTVLFVPAGVSCAVPVAPDGNQLRLPVGDWDLLIRERGANPVLSFAWPATPYVVLFLWQEDGTPREWYVNLQAPLERTAFGFDTVDHVLDVSIAPDRSTWAWKDEAELDEVLAMGLFTQGDAAWFRYWGERAVEHVLLRLPPFDLEWESWRPDHAWPIPELLPGWDSPPSRGR
jgi:predicted RNA-binding protein associated with RNAse of E/G family